MIDWILPQKKDIDKSKFGNKAFNLNKLIYGGFNVPKCVFISFNFLYKYIIEKNENEYLKLEIKYDNFNKMTAIKEWIKGLERDKTITELVNNILCNIKAPYAVRSSSSEEDSSENSYAGLFKTYTNLCTTKEIVDAIYYVFASKYTITIENVNMGVIIQEYIDADIKGVAFSNHPLTNEKNIYIEYTNIKSESVVDGDTVQQITFSNEKIIAEDNLISDKILSELQINIIKTEMFFNYSIDMEWLIKDNILYIVQVRPISQIKNKFPEDTLFIDSLENEKINSYNLEDMKEKHERYQEKHYKIRKLCNELKLKFPKVGYLFYKKSKISDKDLEQLLFASKIYKVVSKDKTRTISKKDLLAYLVLLPGNDNQIVRIQEITLTHACGNVAIIGNNEFYIEYLPGGFGGFLSGELPYSWYKVNVNGEVLDSETYYYNKMWCYDDNSGKFLPKEIDEFRFELNSNSIKKLINIAFLISQFLKNASIEWEKQFDDIYVNDVSFGNIEIEDYFDDKGIMSSGTITGDVVILKDIGPLREILSGRSIVAEKEFYEATKSDILKEYISSIYAGENKFVLITQSPHPSLSILMNYCCGFIFEKGGLLSHLAIILRENKIPARIIPDAINKFASKKYINKL